jgi:O-antigen/teichoic acid export membrane protein
MPPPEVIVTHTLRQRLADAAASVRDVAHAIMAAPNDRAQAQRDALVAFAVRVASAGLLYLSQIVLARWMGALDYGIYVSVWTAVLVLGGLSHLGLSMASIRLIPEYIERGEPALVAGLLRGARGIALLMGTIIAALGLAGVYVLGGRLEGHFMVPAYLALICIPMFALTDMQDGIGRGTGMMAAALAPPYILRPLLVLLAMAAAYAWGLPMHAPTAVAAAIVATWVTALVQTLIIERRLRATLKLVSPRYDFPRWLKTAAPLLVIYACELTLQNADVLILSAYRTPAEVGMYFAAAKTMALVMFVHYAVGSAVAGRFSALSARGDRAALKRFVRDAVNWTFWPSLVAAIGILALGKPLLWLFSPAFTDAYPVMIVLVFGFLVRAAMGPAEYLLNMLGEQVLCALGLTMAALLNIALNVALVPRFGLMGAAIATSTALSLSALFNYVVARRRLELEVSIFENLPRRREASE